MDYNSICPKSKLDELRMLKSKEYTKKAINVKAWKTDEVLYIHTLEGVMKANIGDYIIQGVKGEYYPCKPDVFKETYTLAETEDAEQDYKKMVITPDYELRIYDKYNNPTFTLKTPDCEYGLNYLQVEILCNLLKDFQDECGVKIL